MKLKSITCDDLGRAIITTEQSYFFFWKKQRQFKELRQVVPGFWSWGEVPGLHLVPDNLSFQLDMWRRELQKPETGR
jgi:hypothetical protein